LIVITTKDGIEDTLMDDVAVDEGSGGEVVDLDAVANVEGVFEENEDAPGEEFVEDTADDEGEADEDKGDGLLN
jgi:hypothetical protein